MVKYTKERFEDFKKRMSYEWRCEDRAKVMDVSFAPTNQADIYFLKIANPSQRPPTQVRNDKNQSRQGAHTFSYAAVLKGLVRSLTNVTMPKAKEVLQQFDSWLTLKYSICQRPVDYNKQNVNEYATGERMPGYDDVLKLYQVSRELMRDLKYEMNPTSFCEQVSVYVTVFISIHNMFRDAAIKQTSKQGREKQALEDLEVIEQALQSRQNLEMLIETYEDKVADLSKEKKLSLTRQRTLKLSQQIVDWLKGLKSGEKGEQKVKAIIIGELSSLIDEEAFSTAKESNDIVIGFQVISISEHLISTPKIRDSIFGGDLLLRTDLPGDREVVSNLAQIIYHKEEPDSEKVVRGALGWIQDLRKPGRVVHSVEDPGLRLVN